MSMRVFTYSGYEHCFLPVAGCENAVGADFSMRLRIYEIDIPQILPLAIFRREGLTELGGSRSSQPAPAC